MRGTVAGTTRNIWQLVALNLYEKKTHAAVAEHNSARASAILTCEFLPMRPATSVLPKRSPFSFVYPMTPGIHVFSVVVHALLVGVVAVGELFPF